MGRILGKVAEHNLLEAKKGRENMKGRGKVKRNEER